MARSPFRVTGRASATADTLAAAGPGYGPDQRHANVRRHGAGDGRSRRAAIRPMGRSPPTSSSCPAAAHVTHRRQPADLCRINFAAVVQTGRAVRRHADAEGPGLSGTVDLAAAGRRQQIAVKATANGARTPGDIRSCPARPGPGHDHSAAAMRAARYDIVAARCWPAASGATPLRTARARTNSTFPAVTEPPSFRRGAAGFRSASPPAAGGPAIWRRWRCRARSTT